MCCRVQQLHENCVWRAARGGHRKSARLIAFLRAEGSKRAGCPALTALRAPDCIQEAVRGSMRVGGKAG